jgi:hypothetical protein
MDAMSVFISLIVFCVFWELIWKGIALWRAARNGHSVWYVFLLLFNTLGILPIIYIAFFSNYKRKKKAKRKARKKR